MTLQRFVALAALALGCLAASAGRASANMARAFTTGDQHAPLLAAGPTAVRVDDEELSFEVLGHEDLEIARVTARYRMTNPGAAPAGGDVAFVYVVGDSRQPVDEEPRLTVDGVAVTPRQIDGAALPPGLGTAWAAHPAERLRWLVFRLDFGPGQSRVVEVGYQHVPSVDRGRLANSVATFEYLLSPGKSWASFGPLRVTVKLPEHSELLSSTIPLRRHGDVYCVELPGLPAGELTFSAMYTGNLWFGVSAPHVYLGLLTALLLVTAVTLAWAAARSLRRSRPRRSTLWVALGVGALAWAVAFVEVLALEAAMPPRVMHGLGGVVYALMLVLAAGPIAMIVAAIVAWRRPSPDEEQVAAR
jgi:hypothetical protein